MQQVQANKFFPAYGPRRNKRQVVVILETRRGKISVTRHAVRDGGHGWVGFNPDPATKRVREVAMAQLVSAKANVERLEGYLKTAHEKEQKGSNPQVREEIAKLGDYLVDAKSTLVDAQQSWDEIDAIWPEKVEFV